MANEDRQPAARKRVRKQRRQWGSDGRSPLPAVPSARTERLLSATRIAIFVTLLGWVAFVATTLSKAFFGETFSVRYAADAVDLSRGGHAAHGLGARVSRSRGSGSRTGRASTSGCRGRRSTRSSRRARPTLTVIVPSYREDASVDPPDAALGGAAGVPGAERRAADRRPAEPERPAQPRAARVGARAAARRSTSCCRRRASGSSRARALRGRRARARRGHDRGHARRSPANYVEASSILTAIAADFDEADAAREVRAQRGRSAGSPTT